MVSEALRLGLRHTATLVVGAAHAVPAQRDLFGGDTKMPPVFATANMIAFVEWTCVAALTPYIPSHQRTVGTRVDMSHLAATPIGMTVTAEVELIEIDARRLRFQVTCRDKTDTIGEGFHERTIIDNDRFMARLARKSQST